MSSIKEMLDEWYMRVSVTQRAHYLSAGRLGRQKYWLGIPSVVLATIVGTAVFASISSIPKIWVQIVLGLASVAAAVLTSLQTFLGYSERAEKHRLAGAKYGALGRELEHMRSGSANLSDKQISDVRERLDALAIESPDTPQPIYYKAGAGLLEAPSSPTGRV